MSAAERIAIKVHKWLALLMAIQILFWFASGLFFAAVPIERVRSEHEMAKAAPVPIVTEAAAAGLARIAAVEPEAQRVELRSLVGRPVALVAAGAAPPRLYDLATARRLGPIGPATATAIAERDLAGGGRGIAARLIDRASPEYRGALPAWRVDFDQAGRSVYVAADTGQVTARRSNLWRVYDFLWALHIMDFRGHEDFNTPLLVIATSLGLVVLGTGLVLFPSRLGYTAWRRRRRQGDVA